MKQEKSPSKQELRNFGLVVGGVFLLIGLWPLLMRGEGIRLWASIPGGALVLFGLILPQALKIIYRGWMAVGLVLGWINTRIILGLVYFGLFTPFGLLMRARGKDLMNKKLVREVETYRVLRTRRAPVHLKRQF